MKGLGSVGASEHCSRMGKPAIMIQKLEVTNNHELSKYARCDNGEGIKNCSLLQFMSKMIIVKKVYCAGLVFRQQRCKSHLLTKRPCRLKLFLGTGRWNNAVSLNFCSSNRYQSNVMAGPTNYI